MKAIIKDNTLYLEIPMYAPRPSASGKTLVVATSNGQPVIVGLNAYIKP